METALSVISNLPSGKDQMIKFKRMLKDEILANTKNPLPILVNIQYAVRTFDDILKDEEIEHHFLKEFLLYDKNEKLVVNGATLNEQETGVKYHYEDSGDPVWFDLDKQIKELTEKRKEREKFLQNIPYDAGIVDANNGSVFITRPPKSSKTKIVVKFI
jgi:hypothetical protein